MRKLAKRLLERAHLLSTTQAYLTDYRLTVRMLRGLDQKIAQEHLELNSTHSKLHIGCGDHLLEGWLNTDFLPVVGSVMHLDATDTFPFQDNLFECIYSEHMIEHVPYLDGCSMLKECCRVLRKGGRIRISTPDLAFLFRLYQENPGQLETDYIQWSTSQFSPAAPAASPTFVINNLFNGFGHRFIYDEPTLQFALEQAGFSSVKRCSIGRSKIESFQSLDNTTKMPPGFLELESLILEAEKA